MLTGLLNDGVAESKSATRAPTTRDRKPPTRAVDSVRGTRAGLKPVHLAALAAGVAVSILVFLPVQFPLVVETYGQIKSAQEWVLVRGTDGQLTASAFHFDTGLGGDYGVFHFGNEGSVRFHFHPSLAPGRFVAKGDTIGSIRSSEVEERLVALRGQLATARASLAVDASGDKLAIVREAQQRLRLARQAHEDHLKRLERARKLLAQDLVTQGEYELVESEANLLSVEMGIAETNLEAARTGQKPEQLELTRANIAALESEIAAVQKRAAGYTLTAPISGTITRSFSADTLLTISDTAKYTVFLPVKWSDYPAVSQAQGVRVHLGSSESLSGTLTDLNQKVQRLNGDQVVMATALLDEPSEPLMPGMLAACRIQCPPLTALEYVKRFFDSLLS